MNQVVEVEVEVEVEEIMSDPIAVAFVYDYNIRIEVRADNCDQQYEVALFDSDQDSVIRRFVVNEFEHAMQKMQDLTAAFADRR